MAVLSSRNFIFNVSSLIYIVIILNLAWKTDETIILGKDKLRHRKILVSDDLSVYCYEGEAKVLANIWKTVYFRVVNLSPENYRLFPGGDEQDVMQRYEASAQSWFQLIPWHWETVRLQVFNNSCVGVHAAHTYEAQLDIIRVDYWRVSLLIVGLLLYHFSASLSANIFFHYTTGIILGITTSVLLLIFIISRFIPKKSGAAALLFGGWAIVLYVVQKLWSNLSVVLQGYRNYVAVYVCVVGIISFAVCYRYGPVENTKTLNLIKWSLQALGLAFVYISSDWQEVSMAVVIVVLITSSIPLSWKNTCKTYWRRRFPPKVKLLNEDEYYHQGNVETQKALNELRKFCQSPECSPWKIMSRLKTPVRFAGFAEGNSHLSDEEILEYETSVSFKYDHASDSDSSNE